MQGFTVVDLVILVIYLAAVLFAGPVSYTHLILT